MFVTASPAPFRGLSLRRAATIPLLFGALLLMSAPFLSAEARASTVSWNVDADGDWNVGTNWSTGLVPTAADSVVIDRPGFLITVTVSTGSQAAVDVRCEENLTLSGGGLDLSGGTIQVNGSFTLQGGILADAVVAPGSGPAMTLQSGTLDGVTLDGNVASMASTPTAVTVLNGLTVNATLNLGSGSYYSSMIFSENETLGGTGEVVFSGTNIYNELLPYGPVTLTIGPDLTVRGQWFRVGTRGTTGSVVNHGTVIGDVTGGTVTLSGYPWENQGTVRVTNGSTVTTSGGDWDNTNGVLEAVDGTLNLGGRFTPGTLGTIDRTMGSGGTVNLTGTLDLEGSLFTVDSSMGVWNLATSYGRILNGTLAKSGGGDLVLDGGVLDGVTLASDFSSGPTTGTITVVNGLTINATLTLLQSTNNLLVIFNGNQTLGGTGQVVFQGSSNGSKGRLGGGLETTLTIGPALTIRGQKFDLSGSSATASLVNQGVVIAEEAGGSVTLTGHPVVNLGTIRVTNGSSLYMQGNGWDNSNGVMEVVDGILHLGGSFTPSSVGTIDRSMGSGGEVRVSGILDLGGGTFTLDSSLGVWELDSGRIQNGTLATSGSGGLMLLRGTLDAVTLASDVVTSDANSVVTVLHGLTVNATLTLGSGASYGALTFSGDQTLGGTGEVVFQGTNDLNGLRAKDGTTLTIGPDLTVRGQPFLMRSINSTSPVVNQGTVLAEAPGAEVILEANPWVNQGQVSVLPGAHVVAPRYLQSSGSTFVDSAGILTGSDPIDIEGGTLSGTGRVSGDVLNGGAVSPGSSPGTLRVTGNYTQTGVGRLDLEVGGKDPGDSDFFIVEQTAALAGSLQVSLAGDFAPSLDDSFVVMHYKSLSGSFDEQVLPPLDPGLVWQVVPAEHTLTLIVAQTNPPVAACRNLIVRPDSLTCVATVSPADANDGSYDPDGDGVTFALSPPGPYPIGVHDVELVVTDTFGAADSCHAVVTVTTGPLVAQCQDLTVNADTTDCTAAVVPALLDAGSYDAEGDSITFQLEPPGPFPTGANSVQFIASDGCESDTCSAVITVICSSAGTDPVPPAFRVAPPSPSPFRAQTALTYSLPDRRPIRLEVYDVTGRRVAELVDRVQGPGEFTAAWNGRAGSGARMAAGIYLFRLEAGPEREVYRVVLLP